jgi:ABC-type nitrate/sulfonate/bicarbonate transport system permease component
MKAILTRVFVQLWLAVVALVLLLVITSFKHSLYFPPFSKVLSDLWDQLQTAAMWQDITYSLKNLIEGVALATVVGVSAGLIIGERPRLRRATAPLLDFGRATPHIALVPVILITLGLGTAPKVFLIVFGSVWAVLLNTVNGVRGINPAVLETARSYRIPWSLRLRQVILQGALPSIAAGVRIALSIGIVLMIVSELYGSTQGLGFFILTSGSNFQIVDTWAGTLLIGIIGYLLSLLLVTFEYWLLAAHQQRVRSQIRPDRRGSSITAEALS